MDPEIVFFTSVVLYCTGMGDSGERLKIIKFFLMLLNFFLFCLSSLSLSLFLFANAFKIMFQTLQ